MATSNSLYALPTTGSLGNYSNDYLSFNSDSLNPYSFSNFKPQLSQATDYSIGYVPPTPGVENPFTKMIGGIGTEASKWFKETPWMGQNVSSVLV